MSNQAPAIEVQGLVKWFGDTNVEPGVNYYYAVTAVDRDGNESPTSAPVAVTPFKPE